MRPKKKAWIAVVAALVVAGVAAAIVKTSSDVMTVEVRDVAREDLDLLVSASGQVDSDRSIPVYPPTAGTIESVEVTEGDRVAAGEVLAIMDAAPIEVQAAQAEAAYKAAVAQRDAVNASAPSSADLEAADAAVKATHAAYVAADQAAKAAGGGGGAGGTSELAQAEAVLKAAETAAQAAKSAYDAFYRDIYQPAPEPRDPALESGLAGLALAKDSAERSVEYARSTVAALKGASMPASRASAAAAREQAYAAYTGAVAQKKALLKASDTRSAKASADAGVKAAEVALAYAGKTLERAKITAPQDGIVVFSSSGAAAMELVQGASGGGGLAAEGLSPGASVTPAAPIFTIVDLTSLVLEAQVDEADAPRVKPGMHAEISLDGFPEDTLPATVDRVATQSVRTVTGGTAFPVRLRFDPGDMRVLLGMNGSAEIKVDTIPRALTIPVEALLEDDKGAYVYTVRDGRANRVDIEIGQMTDTHVEVLSGLDEQDEVIVTGLSDLADGSRVKAD